MTADSIAVIYEDRTRLSQIWSIIASVIKRLRAFNSEVHRRRKIRADMEILRSMSDHMLNDIGIRRFEIDYIIYNGREIDRIRDIELKI